MSWDLLQRFLESDVFNSDPFLSVSYLSRYADHVGIHYVLCNKLRQFPYEDIEFFLPQLCHLIISVDNESMALEEFLLDLCEESVTAALLTFWLFQTYLHDLAPTPQTKSFQTCRRVYNKVQHIVFGVPDAARHEKIKENIVPVTVLASFVLSAVATPFLPSLAGPLAVAQARKPQPSDDLISDSLDNTVAVSKVTRARTMTAVSSRSRRVKDGARNTSAYDRQGGAAGVVGSSSSPPTISHHESIDSLDAAATAATTAPSEPKRKPSHLAMRSLDARLSSSSLPLPDLRSPRMATRPATPVSAGIVPPRASEPLPRRHSHYIKNALTVAELSPSQKTRLLRQHYFKCQTQFLTALEGISHRLVSVPKLARLSALRAELALIAQDLPAEVDVPVICPPTLVNGSPSKSRHHRIVRLNPAEATVLNSAEKVPYLLMVEILRDDFSFDPDSPDNQRLINNILAEQGSSRRIFDLSDSSRRIPTLTRTAAEPEEPVIDSVFEPVSGDLGSSPLLRADDEEEELPPRRYHGGGGGVGGGAGRSQPPMNHPQRLSSGQSTVLSSAVSDMATPRSSGASTRSSSPGPSRKIHLSGSGGRGWPAGGVEQPDISALATHMRTASQMLAQLDATSGKRPKGEVAAIRTRIIASMQSLEEQSFDLDDGTGPTFDTIMAKASAAKADLEQQEEDEEDEDEDGNGAERKMNAKAGAAGIARMENDIKTGGLQRKSDRDDPSAAVFGEAWQAKKARIRKTSPYGWMKNWDLVSVIVKTGDDLRQEAFACQLIQVCHKIWVEAGVDVWVKLMRILVTGESSGLVETITNGVSLHSIKRSLTMSMMASGAPNQRRRVATLKDHFVKAFGPVDSEPHRAGVDAFKRSLAAYSVISYILQLKDRHNGNVLIDSEGHIVHIDFGFMLSNSPGSVGFEAAPFKLTHEYVDVLGGIGSEDYDDYKTLCKQAFQALRRSADSIIDLVAMMGRESKMPCFSGGVVQTTHNLRQRFQLQLSAEEAEQYVETDLIGKSLGSYYTRLYDTFQYRTQGIY